MQSSSDTNVPPQDPRPLRVERALWMMPDLEALAPLRAAVVAMSHEQTGVEWSSAARYATVGKRNIWPLDVRERRRQVLHQVTRHIGVLYEAVMAALEGEQRGDVAAAVRALLGAADAEERVGRLVQARAWCEQALVLSVDFQNRQLEFDALCRLGHLAAVRGEYEEAGRYYQRGLALAEEERNDEGVIRVCQGLGRLGRGMGQWGKGDRWLARGLALAETTSDQLRMAQLSRDLGDVARRGGDPAKASEMLQLARGVFEELGAAEDLAFTLQSQAQLDAGQGRRVEALAAYREALSWLRRGRENLWLEVSIRINIANLFMDSDRFSDAVEQLREAEEIAIVHTFDRGLAQTYTALGKVCRRRMDENGFVFFEKALELCRGAGRAPIVEAHVRYEYGVFRSRLGEREAALAHLERAQDLYEWAGDEVALASVQEELARLET